jgi:hypothetical protein
MKTCIYYLTVSILLSSGYASTTNTVEVRGEVSDVIVYRGQALVTRTIEVELPAGSSEIIVTDMPDRLVTDSLSAKGPEGVSIASVRYREKKTTEDTREEVKELESKIEQVKKNQFLTKRDLDIANWFFERFSGRWDLFANVGQDDPNRVPIQPQAIESLADYLEAKAIKYHENVVASESRQQDLEKELKNLERELNKLRSQVSSFEREAVISLTQNKKGSPILKFSYLVDAANWLAQYNLRAQPASGSVTIEYNALVFQTSGEDWNDVTVQLSTAQPAMIATTPGVEPMEVKLGQPTSSLSRFKRLAEDKIEKDASSGYARAEPEYRDLSQQMEYNIAMRHQAGVKGKAGEEMLNKAAVAQQVMELQADLDEVQVIKAQTMRIGRVEGVSVTYDIPGRLSVPSKTAQQLVNITSFDCKADFYAVGSPILTDYVYLQGDISNNSDTILLAGPASMYRDDEFAGKGNIDLVTMGEKFTAGFGVDSQIRISREFKDKKVDTLFGNRIDTFNYRIAIENYKNTNVKLQLLERIPYTKDEELQIQAFETNTPLSKDPDYVRTLKDKGILRWDLQLAPNMVADKARVVTYSYTMKYDKGMQIQPVPTK